MTPRLILLETQIIDNDYTRATGNHQSADHHGDRWPPGVDNLDQANRLGSVLATSTARISSLFRLTCKALAGLLEVGDGIAVNHSNMPGRPHIPVIIEEFHEPNMEVPTAGPQVQERDVSDDSQGTTIAIETAVTWPTNASSLER